MDWKGFDEGGNKSYEIIKGEDHIKEYDIVGYLEFEGDYLNGERNGKGKIYCTDSPLGLCLRNVIFDGEFLNN